MACSLATVRSILVHEWARLHPSIRRDATLERCMTDCFRSICVSRFAWAVRSSHPSHDVPSLGR
jgi:hypothetical protein